MNTADKNILHPKKLLMSKWTAVHPENKEKHFLVVKVIDPGFDNLRQPIAIEQVVIEAIISKRQKTISWRNLRDAELWKQGWVD